MNTDWMLKASPQSQEEVRTTYAARAKRFGEELDRLSIEGGGAHPRRKGEGRSSSSASLDEKLADRSYPLDIGRKVVIFDMELTGSKGRGILEKLHHATRAQSAPYPTRQGRCRAESATLTTASRRRDVEIGTGDGTMPESELPILSKRENTILRQGKIIEKFDRSRIDDPCRSLEEARQPELPFTAHDRVGTGIEKPFRHETRVGSAEADLQLGASEIEVSFLLISIDINKAAAPIPIWFVEHVV